MAKSQPKIDDIKDLNKVTVTSDGLMSKEDKTKLDNLNYGDLGDMPVATDTEVGGIKIGYDNILSASPEAIAVRVSNYGDDNDGKAFVVMTSRNIKQILGVNNSTIYNGDDIFVSGLETPSGNFNEIFLIGSYRVYGSYSNAPNPVCGTSAINTVVKGSLNVFRSGVNDWETIQQLFWVRDGKTEQYQRSYSGSSGGTEGTWTIWKRLIKCDDYADLDGNGGIISSANLAELFRAPDIIQLWNNVEDSQTLGEGTYNLDLFTYIDVTIRNILKLEGNEITTLTPERVYRVTYEVHFVRKEGEGEVTILIENEDGVLHSVNGYIFNWQNNRSITFSVMLTNLDYIRPVIVISGGLTVFIPPHGCNISVEEIKYPYFTPNPLTH